MKNHSLFFEKFVSLSFISFFLVSNYIPLRAFKATLIVMPHYPEYFSLLKPCATLTAIFFAFLYIILCNYFSRDKLFYIVLSFFSFYFLVFGFFLYPDKGLFFNLVYSQFPFLRDFFIFLYCILTDLWPIIIIAFLFWQFANDVIDFTKAKILYPIIIFISGLGYLISSPFLYYTSLFFEENPYKIIVLFIFFTNIIVICIHRWLYKKVILVEKRKDLSKPLNLSFTLSIGHIIISKYLWLIAFMLFSIRFIVNSISYLLKNHINSLYPDTHNYITFMSSYSYNLSYFGILMIFFLPLLIFLLRKFGWLTAAIMPIIIVFFVGLSLCLFPLLKLSPDNTDLALIFSFILFMSQTSKSFFFNTIKEMAYIPLNSELKLKGKAFVDIIIGSLLTWITSLFTAFSSSSPYDSIAILIIICILWFFTVKSLNTEIKRFTKN